MGYYFFGLATYVSGWGEKVCLCPWCAAEGAYRFRSFSNQDDSCTCEVCGLRYDVSVQLREIIGEPNYIGGDCESNDVV